MAAVELTFSIDQFQGRKDEMAAPLDFGLPEGFTLDEEPESTSAASDLPTGFTLDSFEPFSGSPSFPDPAKTGLLPEAPEPTPTPRAPTRDRRQPASVRFANPGAMYPGPSSQKFGATATETIGGGHKIAVFPDMESGAAAQFDLLNRGYTGLSLRDALRKWSGGNHSNAYTKAVSRATGLSPDAVLTPDMIRDPSVAVPLAKAMARVEAGADFPMSDDEWQRAHARAFGAPIQTAATPSETQSTQAPRNSTDLLRAVLGAPPEQRRQIVEDYLHQSLGIPKPQRQELPPGFTLDEGPGAAELPEGFTLDKEGGTPAAAEKEGFFSGLWKAISTGTRQTGASLTATGGAYAGSGKTVESAAEYTGLLKKEDPSALKRFSKQIDRDKIEYGDTVWGGIRNVASAAYDNPEGVLQFTVQQLPNMGVAMGAGLAGAGLGAMTGPLAPIAAPVGFIAGMFLGNTALETGGKAIEKARGGATDDELADARKEGAIKGGIITAVDTATLGLGRWVLGTASRAVERATAKVLTDHGIDAVQAANTIKAAQRQALEASRGLPKDQAVKVMADATVDAMRRTGLADDALVVAVRQAQDRAIGLTNKVRNRIARYGGAVSLQGLGEGAGELFGEFAATGEWKPTDAVLEALAGLVTGPAEIEAARPLTVERARTLTRAFRGMPSPAEAEGTPSPGSAPTTEQPPADAAPAAEAPAAEPAPSPTPPPATEEETALLRAQGWTDEEIADMDPAERAEELAAARAQGVTPQPLAPDRPTAEPSPDLVAQASDLTDPDNPRRGLYVPRSSLEALLSDPDGANALANVLEGKAVSVDDFDGQGGMLVVPDDATAQWAVEQKDSGRNLQEIIGELTGAGRGKPIDGTHAVQQVTPEGAVTRESLVTEDQVAATEAEFTEPGRDVRTVTPEEALRRREEEIAAQQAPVGDGSRQKPVKVRAPEDIERAAERVQEPTEAQAEKGNYPHGHLDFQGLQISVETPKGGTRRGVKDGKELWRVDDFPTAYGYVKRTEGRDGDQVDVYVGDAVDSDRVWIIDQVDADTKAFDEHKAWLGFTSEDEVRAAYERAFSDGRASERLGGITEMPLGEFKDWLAKGKRTRPLTDLARREPVPEAVEPAAEPTETPAAPTPAGEVVHAKVNIHALANDYADAIGPQPNRAKYDAFVRGAQEALGPERRAIVETRPDGEVVLWSLDRRWSYRNPPKTAYRIEQDAAQAAPTPAGGEITGEPAPEPEPAAAPVEAAEAPETGPSDSEAVVEPLVPGEPVEDADEIEAAPAAEPRPRGPDQLKDYSAQTITGYLEPGEEGSGEQDSARKRAFLADARNYLLKVAKDLEQRGFEPYTTEKKGRKGARTEKMRPVSVNPGGPAVSGDVTLNMIDAEGRGVHVTIGTALAGPSGGISLMARTQDRNRRSGPNQWWPTDLTAKELADRLERLARGEALPKADEQPPAKKPRLGTTLDTIPKEDKGKVKKAVDRVRGEAGSVVPSQPGEPDLSFIPHAYWRENQARARVYANALKIDHRGMSAEEIVAAIDAKLAALMGAPSGVSVELSDRTLDAEEARVKGGEFKAIARRDRPAGSYKVEDGYGDTPEEAMRNALRRVGVGVEERPTAQKTNRATIDDLKSQVEGWLARGDVARGAVRDHLEGALRDIEKGDVEGAILLIKRGARNTGNKEIGDWANGLEADAFDVASRAPEPVEPEPAPAVQEAEEPAEAAPAPAEAPETTDPLAPLVVVLRGEGFKNIVEARKFVKDAGILPKDATNKQIDETIESAVVAAARQIVSEGGTPAEVYQRLIELYANQPNLGTRTSTSVANQAYSTPVPLAYIASRLAGVATADVVYEPTAGNGALLIEAGPGNDSVHANELDPARAAELERQGFKVTTEDATEGPSLEAPADAIVMNPPFGAVREGGKSKDWTIDGWTTSQVDHAIALQSLKAMTDDGRAVLILGGIKADSIEERRKGYRGKAKREFYFRLYNQYNVTDHFTVDGDLYSKQGASWPVDVVVIEGRGKSERPLPAAEPPTIFKDWDSLAEKLPDATATAQIDTAEAGRPVEPSRRPSGEVGGAPSRDEVSSPETGRGRPERLLPETGDDAVPVRGDGDSGQPGDVRGGRRDELPAVSRPDPDTRRADKPAPAERVRPRVEREVRGGQATYQPVSSTKPLETLIPVNMADAARSAMERIEQRHGSVDEFVADRLGYDPKDLSKHFGAEQIDAIAAAIDNIERGSAMIVGDATGIGKGRIAAGVLRYAMRQGKIPVLVTEKPDLYGDMWRDMRDIGLPEMLGREPRIFMTNTGASVTLDEEALAWKQEADAAREAGQPIPKRRGRFLTGGTAARQAADMRAIAEGKGNHDVVFTTYDQMNTVKGQTTPRRQFLARIARNSLIVADEAHNAGGSGQGGWKKKGAETNRADFMRDLARDAWGVMFSSATYAKRPDVMDLYARTDMGKAVDDPKMLPELIARGGVPMQQIVATMLADSGQYLRRERSFEGVEYAVEGVPVNPESYRQFSDSVRAVFQFDLALQPERKKLFQAALDAAGKTVAKDAGVGDMAAHTTAFASVMHNIVNQMLLSIKTNEVAKRAIAAHKAGEKPVIGLSSTMEAFITDFAAGEGITVGEAIDLSFRDVLARYLRRTLRVSVKTPDGKTEHIQISADELPSHLQRMYRDALDIINEGDYEGLPISPIDAIRNQLSKAGLKVSEITGRQTMIDYSESPPRYVARPKREMGPSGKRGSISAFNRGALDALIINRSGSTGVSMHASASFRDKRRRRMILAQAEGNIDTHLQMLGRVHRTGQVVPPAYSQIAAEIPAEARPTAVLMKKMASLNANTTGARGSVFMSDAVDFINEVGDRVVANIIEEDSELADMLGNPLKTDTDGNATAEDAAKRVTGRLTLLTPEKQAELLDRISSAYNGEIEQLDALGENPLEAKTLDLQARTLDSTEIKPRQGDSPFLEAVRLEKVSVKAQGRAMAPDDVARRVAETLKAEKPGTDPASSLGALERQGQDWARETWRTVGERARDWITREVAETSDQAKASTESRHQDTLNRWRATLQVAYPGARVRLGMPAGDISGIITKVERTGKAKNPVALGSWEVRIAVPDSAREYIFPMSKLFPPGFVKSEDEKGATIEQDGTSFADLMPQFEEARREGRETRFIFTGNILAAYDQTAGRGRIINFTTESGELRPGILMGREFSQTEFMESRKVRFQSGEQVAQFLARVPEAEIKSTDGLVTLRLERDGLSVITPASRATGGRIYTDPDVRRAVGVEFERRGNQMEARGIPTGRTAQIVDVIRNVGAIFEARQSQDVAQEIIGASATSQAVRDFSNAVDSLKQELGVETRAMDPDAPSRRRMRSLTDTGPVSLKQQVEQIRRGSRLKVVVDHVTGFSSEASRILEVVRKNEAVDLSAATVADMQQFLSSLSDLAQIVENRLQKGYVLADEVQEIGDLLVERIERASAEFDQIASDVEDLMFDLGNRAEEIDGALEELRGSVDEVEDESTALVPTQRRPSLLEQAQQPIPEDASMLDVAEQEAATSLAVFKTLGEKSRDVLALDVPEMDEASLERVRERIDNLHFELMTVRDWASRMSEITAEKTGEVVDLVQNLTEERLTPALDNLEEAQDEIGGRMDEAESRLTEAREVAAGQVVEVDGERFGLTRLREEIEAEEGAIRSWERTIREVEAGERPEQVDQLPPFRAVLKGHQERRDRLQEALNRFTGQRAGGLRALADTSARERDPVDRIRARMLLRQPVDLSREAESVLGVLRAEAPPAPGLIRETAVSAIKPRKGKPDQFIVTIRDTDGAEYEIVEYRDDVLSSSALFDFLPDGTPFIAFYGLDLRGDFVERIRGERAHEWLHGLRALGHLPGRVSDAASPWGRLVRHADSLGVMEGTLYGHLKGLKHPRAENVRDKNATIVEKYHSAYASRSDFREAMDQESVAHMLQQYVHGVLSEQDVAPVRDILDEMLAGRQQPQQIVRMDDGPMFSLIEQAPPETRRTLSRDLTSTPEFRRWFGDSKVVDENGKPLVVYHGTNAEIDAFDPRRRGQNFPDDAGFFFSSDEDTAWGFGRTRRPDGSEIIGAKNVLPVYLSLQNPLVLNARNDDPTEFWFQNKIAYKNQMIDGGHDGVIVRGADFVDDGSGSSVVNAMYVARFPEQIKSATGNRGTFDPSDPRILYSLVRATPQERKALSHDLTEAVNIVGQIAGKEVEVRFFDQIPVELAAGTEQRVATQRMGIRSRTAGGFYQRGRVDAKALIGLATSDPAYDLRTTAGHEAWHHVEEELATDPELRLIRLPSEMARTRRLAAAEIGMEPGDPRLDNLPDKEIRAIAFQRYRRMREEGAQPAGIHIGVRRLWDRIIRIFRAVQNVVNRNVSLRQALAGDGSTEAIFERARRGEFAGRAERRPSVATGLPERQLSAKFEESLPEFLNRLDTFLRTAVPPNVRVRVVDRLRDSLTGDPIAARFTEGALLLEIALRGRRRGSGLDRVEPGIVIEGTMHETVHALRNLGLFSDREWDLLLTHANLRVRPAMSQPGPGGTHSRIDAYRAIYTVEGARAGLSGEALATKVSELLDQEVVARMAEEWIAGTGGKPPSSIRTLLRRIQRFFDALWNAMSDLGFQTADDVFERVVSGEVARRLPHGGPRQPIIYDLAEPDQEDGGSLANIIPNQVQPQLTPQAVIRRGARRTLSRVMNTLDRARVVAQDRMLLVRRAQEQIERDAGIKLPVNLDVYLSEALYHGRAGERLQDLRTKFIEPLVERMRAADIKADELGDYLYARHAQERNATIRKIDPDNDAGSGMTDAEAAAILDRVARSGKQAQYDEVAAIVDDMLRDTRDTLLRAGLEDRETIDRWKAQYQSYVPLRGFEVDDEDGSAFPRVGRGFDVRGPEAFRALGRRSKADNPLLYAVQQAQQAIVRAEKNRVNKTLYRQVQAHPEPSLWKIYKGERRRRVNPETGLIETYWVPPSFVRADNIVGVKIGGKQHWIEIKHPGLLRAVRGVGSEIQGTVLGRALFKAARTYAGLLTSYNPEFLFSNFFRDLETAIINVSDVAEKPEGTRRKIVKDALSAKAIRGAFQALRGDTSSEYARWFEEFRHAGGKISFMEYNDIQRIRTDINRSLSRGRTMRALRNTARLVEDLNTAVENGVRLSVYKTLRENGVAQDRAAFVARELTVNFNRKGEWGPTINALYLFFNASVQGTTRIAQALTRSKAVRWAVGSIFATGMALDVLNFLIAGDDDDDENAYDKIPDWVKERNLIVMIPGDPENGYIQIPLAYGYNVPFLAGQKAMSVIRGVDKPLKAAASVAVSAWDAFNPMGSATSFGQFVAPTFLDPVVQVLENKTWYGGPIFPQHKPKHQPWSETFQSSTPEWAIEVARIMNQATGGNAARSGFVDISPDVLEHYLEFAMGGAGKFVLNAINSGQRVVSSDEWLPEKTPFVRRLFGKTTTVSRYREFYEAWDQVDAAFYEVKELAKDGDQAGSQAARQRYRPELSAYPIMKAANKTLRDMRKLKDRIEADPNLSAEEKRKRIEDLRKREHALILRSLRTYGDAQKEARRAPAAEQ